VWLAFVVATLLALYDLSAGRDVVLIGLLGVGPCLAAVSGRVLPVVAVGAYVLGLALLLSWPDHLWWTREQGFFVAGLTAITGVSAAVARRLRALEEAATEAERVAQVSAERYRRIVDTTSEGVLTTDLDGRITFANAQWGALVGLAPDQVVGRLAADVVPDVVAVDLVDRAVGALVADMAAVVRGDGPADLRRRRAVGIPDGTRQNFRMRCADGRELFVAATVTALKDDEGKPAGLLSMTTDISEQRRLEAQLRQTQKLDAIGQLAGGVAHDFNNMLTVIDGYAELLQAHSTDAGPQRSYVEQIRAAADQAAALTRQLLVFSRKQAVELQDLDLSEVAAGIPGMLRRLIPEHIELTYTPDRGPVPIRADRGHLEQVLVNLAVNGRDAMPSGGRLVIETGTAEVDDEEFQRNPRLPAGRYAVLAVSDTGEGMTEEVKARLFEPFFTTKEPGKGTGLGLATVYGIVRQAGGHVAVYSELGIGTTVKVLLPLAAQPAPADPVGPGGDVPPDVVGGHERILLVEDDDAVRRLGERMLTKSGYTVVVARGGDEALAAGLSDGIDLLVTDMVMAGMNGIELAGRLTARHPGLPVLFVTGYTQALAVGLGVPGGTTDYLDKPFTAVTLSRQVRAALDRRAEAGGAPATV
jgi:two-component system cell cycle sensor histidine kinase/response regulator CckA